MGLSFEILRLKFSLLPAYCGPGLHFNQRRPARDSKNHGSKSHQESDNLVFQFIIQGSEKKCLRRVLYFGFEILDLNRYKITKSSNISFWVVESNFTTS
jgi:hypothetical protein